MALETLINSPYIIVSILLSLDNLHSTKMLNMYAEPSASGF